MKCNFRISFLNYLVPDYPQFNYHHTQVECKNTVRYKIEKRTSKKNGRKFQMFPSNITFAHQPLVSWAFGLRSVCRGQLSWTQRGQPEEPHLPVMAICKCRFAQLSNNFNCSGEKWLMRERDVARKRLKFSTVFHLFFFQFCVHDYWPRTNWPQTKWRRLAEKSDR